MKIISALFIIIILFIQYRIWWGEGSYRQIQVLELKIAEQEKQNQQLKRQNELLKREVRALRENPELLEEKARENLGLIKPGETFYRIIPSDK